MNRVNAALVFLLLVVTAAGARAAALIESIRLVEETGGVDLEILSDAPMTWRAAEEGDGTLLIRLPNTLPGTGVSSLVADEGLVSAVEISTSGTVQPAETRISIRSRQKMTYSIGAQSDRITVRLRYRTESSSSQAPNPPARRSMESPSVAQSGGAQSGGAQSGGVNSVSAGDDRIGPGDVLDIDVFGLDDLDRRTRVAADGTISLPLLGTLLVAGLSRQEAERRIARALSERDLVKDPQVSIFIAEFVSRAVTIQGAVRSPGVYQLMGPRSLLDVIGQAGGMDERAGRSVFVLRSDAGGRQQKIEIDTERLVVEGDSSANIALRPGDVVMIALARTFRIYISGAVENPGAVDFLSSEGITVLQAITAAGGPTNRANLKNTYILRRGPGGTQERIAVNVKKIQKGKVEDLLLRKNDTVVVGEWFF